jgi:hypothetical protein
MNRTLATLLFLTLPFFLTTLGVASDHADQAIDEALELLHSRRANLAQQSERDKVDQAIERLRGADSRLRSTRTETRRATADGEAAADQPPSLATVKISKFIDHTDRYKSQVVTLPLMVRSRELIPPGQTLRALAGGAARFQGTSEDGNRLDLIIDLPRSLEIPKLSFGDRAVVSFRCKEGDLQRGNEAVEIRRPGGE